MAMETAWKNVKGRVAGYMDLGAGKNWQGIATVITLLPELLS